MSTKITDDYFDYGSHKYFRGNAHILQIGSFGEKKDPIGAKSYIDPQNKVMGKILAERVIKGTSISVDWGQTNKTTFEINGALKFFGKDGKLDTNGSYEKVKSANLKLVNFYILETPLKLMLNNDAGAARAFMADEGNDARIVTEVWVAMEAELAEVMDNSTSGSLGITGDDFGVKVTVSHSKSGSTSITLSPGTTFAYKSHKVKNWTNNKTKIDNMEADYHT
jgi:hypothetical protein